jgi:hypothetical protein
MTVADDSAVNVGSRRWSAGGVAQAVGCRIPGNYCVFQSYSTGTNTNATACAFGYEARWQVRSSLVNASVSGLRIVTANRGVIDIQTSGIGIRHRAAMRKAPSTVCSLSARPAAVGFSAIATVTAIR